MNDKRPSGDAATLPSLDELPLAAEDVVELDPLLGQILAERYEVKEKLGEGGMGSVYRAEHVHMKKSVAVKVLHRHMMILPEVVARFEREAVAAGRIDHAHVARATDFGRLDGGGIFLVLEFVEGHDLGVVLGEGAMPLLRALGIARQIADALDAAHSAGVIHRDLKPENVMLLDRPGEPDFVKVLDFGIAKLEMGEGPALTQLGSVFGTPQYMSPEQAEGRPVDARSDLYTLGLILYEMLSGVQPFRSDDIAEVLVAQMKSPPPPLPAGIDLEVQALVGRLLAKSVDARPSSAAEVVREIDVLLGRLGEVAAGPVAVPVWEQSPSWRDPAPSSRDLPPEATSAVAPRSLVPRPRDLHVGGVVVPAWALVAAGLALFIGVAFGLFGLIVAARSTAAPVASTVVAAPSGSAPVVVAPRKSTQADQALYARAASGDIAAMAEMEKRPGAERTAEEWLTLARGQMVIGHKLESVAAYDRALALDPTLASDPTLLRHIRSAAYDADAGTEALRVAENHLGQRGADLLYDVWVATKAKNATTQIARQLVLGTDVRARATPALDIAIDLRLAQSCEVYRKLLPRAALHGDTRALRLLMPLTQRRGCGFLKLGDCYKCLRGDESLNEAVKAAKQRQEPRF